MTPRSPRTKTRIGAALVLLVTLGATPALARPRDPYGLGHALVVKLRGQPGIRPETHATDFGDDALGCITFAQWELRRFGYRGHAFVCEEGATHEVLGAVLGRTGVVRCQITGSYAGDGCFALEICDQPLRVCVE